jgi:hypothetical protein
MKSSWPRCSRWFSGVFCCVSLLNLSRLPPPDVLAQEIADDLEAALEQFSAIAEKL